MGFFNGAALVKQKALYVRDDAKVLNEMMEIRDVLIVRNQQTQSGEAWPYQPSLLTPITWKGKYRGEYYLVSSRNGEPPDPCNQLPPEYKGEKLLDLIYKVANEEHNRVVAKEKGDNTNKATVWLSVGAAAYTILLGLSIFMSRGGH